MKRLFSILIAALMVLSVLPVSAVTFAEKAPAEKPAENAETRSVSYVEFDFDEVDPCEDYGFTFVDADADEYNWFLVSSLSGDDESHSGEWAMRSDSWNSDAGALDPDNWMITPAIEFGSQPDLHFWMMSHDDEEYLDDHLEVWYTVDDGLNWQLLDDFYGCREWTEFQVDIRDCADGRAMFAFRHCDSYDQWHLYIDDIEFRDAEISNTVAAINLDYYAEPYWGIKPLIPSAREGSPYTVNCYWQYKSINNEWKTAGNYFDRDGAEYRLRINVTLDSGYQFTGNNPLILLDGSNNYIDNSTVVVYSDGTMTCATTPVTVHSGLQTSDIYAFYQEKNGNYRTYGWYDTYSIKTSRDYYGTEMVSFGGSLYVEAAAYLRDKIYYVNPGMFVYEFDTVELTERSLGQISTYEIDSLAFDYETGDLYTAYRIDSAAYIGLVDIDNGLSITAGSEITGIENTGGKLLIAVTGPDVMYCLTTGDMKLFRVDIPSGAATFVGVIGPSGYPSNLFYDTGADQLYLSYSSTADEECRLYVVDRENANVTLSAEILSNDNKVFSIAVAKSHGAKPISFAPVTVLNSVIPFVGSNIEDNLDVFVPDGDHPYSVVMESTYYSTPYWEGSDGTFATSGPFLEGVEYSLRYTLAADPGYYFAENCVYLINGKTGCVDTGYMQQGGCDFAELATFPMTAVDEDHIISEVSLDGFVPPVVGYTAEDFFSSDAPEDAPYHVVIWTAQDVTDSENWFVIGSADVYEAAHYYRYYVTFEANEGYYFADELDYWTNNTDAYVDTNTSYRIGPDTVMLCTESIRAMYAIDTVNVYGLPIPPMVGETAGNSLNLFVDFGGHYSIFYSTWLCPEGQCADDYIFEAGEQYRCVCTLLTDDGWCFAPDCTIRLNDGTDFIAIAYTSSDLRTVSIQTVYMEAADDSKLIHEIDFSEFARPVLGDPVTDFMTSTYLTDDSCCSIIETYPLRAGYGLLDGTEVFEEGYEYALAFIIEAAPGYYIADDCIATVEGETDLIGSGTFKMSPTKMRVTIGPMEPKAAITEIRLNGFVNPTPGQTVADYLAGITLPADAEYTLFRIQALEQGNSTAMQDTDAFVEGHEYYFVAYLMANEETHLFSGNAEILLDGSTNLLQLGFVFTQRSTAYITTKPITCGSTVTLAGDVNCDGKVDATDALLAMRYSMNLAVVDEQGIANGDINGDGKLNATDAIAIMRMAMAG